MIEFLVGWLIGDRLATRPPRPPRDRRAERRARFDAKKAEQRARWARIAGPSDAAGWGGEEER